MADEQTQSNNDNILNRYHNLSPELQDAVFSMDTASAIQKIGTNNKLTVFQIGVLADETGRLLMGITHPSKFITNLSERMKLDREKVKIIADEANQIIFSKVRESIRKLNEDKPEIKKDHFTVSGISAKKDTSSYEDKLAKLIKPVSTSPENKEVEKEMDTDSESKDILVERNKDDVLRMKPSVSDVSENKTEEKVDNQKTGQEKTGSGPSYIKGNDPYREPY